MWITRRFCLFKAPCDWFVWVSSWIRDFLTSEEECSKGWGLLHQYAQLQIQRCLALPKRRVASCSCPIGFLFATLCSRVCPFVDWQHCQSTAASTSRSSARYSGISTHHVSCSQWECHSDKWRLKSARGSSGLWWWWLLQRRALDGRWANSRLVQGSGCCFKYNGFWWCRRRSDRIEYPRCVSIGLQVFRRCDSYSWRAGLWRIRSAPPWHFMIYCLKDSSDQFQFQFLQCIISIDHYHFSMEKLNQFKNTNHN